MRGARFAANQPGSVEVSMSDSSMKPAVAAERSTARLKMYIGGEWRAGSGEHDVFDPYRRERVASAPESTLQDLDDALAAATAAKSAAAAMPGYERAALLRKVSTLLVERADGIAEAMSRETGKAIKDARAEVVRSQDTLQLSAEEAIRIQGEQVPLDGTPMGAGKIAFLLRFPVGVVAGITPFNAPFNLACHKIAPAIAAGNTIVLKAPPQSPWVVSKLVELFHDAGTPRGFVNLLYGNAAGPALVRDARVDFVSFTGSSRVGAEIKAASGMRRVALELGGNGTTIVHADASVEEAAPLCARNSMRLAGQSCISVQNVYVHESIYDIFVERLVQEVKPLRLGDPLDPATDIGTLIDEAAARRVENWVAEATASGARALTGARRHGAAYEPTVLVDVDPSMRVVCEEVFGPVVTVQRYRDLPPLFERISAAPYGLHCGIFTKSLQVAFDAIRALRVGGIIVNGTSTWRTDQLAYGGIKSSGIGREGPRYAMRDMTEERLVLFNL
jgi:acyl-CoA reductase-like NAD-dependent aldehyde dehydrogenase